MSHLSSHDETSRLALQADCASCFGLCCVALPFAASADFAVDKAAGEPCRNLRSDFRCGVHDSLRQIGFRGCTVYDCFGAGQKVSQITFGGSDWRQAPESAKIMFGVFPIMRQLHELLAYLTEALTWRRAASIHPAIRDALGETERLTLLDPDSLMELNVAAHRAAVNELLLRASECVRADFQPRQKQPSKRGADRKGANLRGADLIGASLKRADLRGANLRGAYLIAADLRHADMRFADLIGADCRDANFSGADLSESLFLTQFQINSAIGDAATKLPPLLVRPLHWNG